MGAHILRECALTRRAGSTGYLLSRRYAYPQCYLYVLSPIISHVALFWFVFLFVRVGLASMCLPFEIFRFECEACSLLDCFSFVCIAHGICAWSNGRILSDVYLAPSGGGGRT